MLPLCRLWTRRPPTRLFTAAAGQRSGPSNYYELLGLHPGASTEEVKRAFFSKSKELSRAAPHKSPGTTAHPRATHQSHSSSWAPPNAQYWAQFYGVRPKGPELRQQQHKHNQRVLGYCLLVMLAGMGLHYVAFRKLEQMHRNFMDEKDRIITAIYNDTRARARASRARLQREHLHRQQHQPAPRPPQGPEIVPRGTSP
ncbi:dnaJ homolog subfamily C member 4 isoform X3 [Manis pentadactyla]|uniref:dnaJ homolog subfamily C member 4 isoform X3 n=1 Tax=Manis pentadactyla TaxID=143292 RepID=UPI00255C8454|nr:dnaJ homolog subfamily C member 4 isoform X3 [Manis pentadactyla]